MIKYAEASISETGGINGKKGDQSNEVRISNVYNHRLGWRTFRHPDANIRKWIGLNGKFIAQNQHFGYGQTDRTSGYNACIQAGYEPRRVAVDVNIDCSEMVRTCVACAMEKNIPDFSTFNEASVLLSLGFKEVTDGSLTHGDIRVTKTKGHTVIAFDDTVTSGVPQPTASQKQAAPSLNDAYYVVRCANGKTYPQVKNIEDFAGVENIKICDLAVRFTGGGARYRVHVIGGGWLPWVTGYTFMAPDGYAGNGKPIDAVQIVHTKGKNAHYRVSYIGSPNFLPWVVNDSDYAGIFGKPIDKIQIYVD